MSASVVQIDTAWRVSTQADSTADFDAKAAEVNGKIVLPGPPTKCE